MVGHEVDPKAGGFHDWFPQSWLDECLSVKGVHANAILKARQRRCDAHADYLAAAVELGEENVRFDAMSILKFRAVDGDAGARDTLRSPLSRPCGPDEVRLDLDRWLEGRGFVEAGQPRDLLLRDEIKQLDLRAARLHAVQR
ncbi:MAG: hypothetical protein V7606_265 [Burkholderiales bacterium]